MRQNFQAKTSPATGAAHAAGLRAELERAGLAGFIVPRGDRHMGEDVAPHDERLAWLTGFSGSAGCCLVLRETAEIYVDGRYTLQVRHEVDTDVFTPQSSDTHPLAKRLPALVSDGDVIGFDPWLHGKDEIDGLEKALAGTGAELRPSANLIDLAWADQPAPPAAPMVVQPDAFTGQAHAGKRANLAATLQERDIAAAILTLPDSIAWLLNVRGGDIKRTPVAHAFAILHDSGRVDLYTDPAKVGADVLQHFGNEVSVAAWSEFDNALDRIGATGASVLVDRIATPVAVLSRITAAGGTLCLERDPCVLPKARKTPTEIAGAHAAHLRDGAAFARFLHWLDNHVGQGLDEIAVVTALERFREETGEMRDISFETICGAGPNGAIVHYRVSEDTNRAVTPGDILLVDSGGQYLDGTTDITRTMATGPVPEGAREAFTRVLRGMIAISRARFPAKTRGRELDTLARVALWEGGQDYSHGTGHGVGSYLGVHEGPQSLSRRGTVALEAGMILSNEPGYYREGAFGIRIENLVVVTPAEVPPGGDRPMHSFDTLTLAPIDQRLILPAMLNEAERDWLDAYHAHVAAKLTPLVEPEVQDWLRHACAPQKG